MTDLRHLHVHTEYSLLDGFCKINKLMPRLKELGMDSIAITDHGSMYGVIDFYQEAKKYGIKPIIGFEAYVFPSIDDPSCSKEVENISELYNELSDVIKEIDKQNKKKTKKKSKDEPEVITYDIEGTPIEDEPTIYEIIDGMLDEETREMFSNKMSKTALKALAIEDTVKYNTTYFGNSVIEEVLEMDKDGEQLLDEDENPVITTKYKLKQSHLVLLARNNKGYSNLMKLASIAQLEGFYKKPLLDFETLKQYGEGIIATSACRAGEIPRMIMRGRPDLAERLAVEYREIFDEFYLEIQPSEISEQLLINAELIEMSKRTGMPLIATSDAHYVRREDFHTHDVLLAVAMGKDFDDENRMRFQENVNYIMTEEEMLLYGIPQEAINNTKIVADKCNVEIELGKMNFPTIDIPAGYTPRQYIEKLSIDGLYKRYNSWPDEKKAKINMDDYIERIMFELGVIEDKGIIDYFLITRDFIRYAKDNNIYVGPGRGSAAGCMVSYCLEITNLDPIQYNLLFSRFLNPERMSMPDIDIDFEEYIKIPELFESGREKVVDYVVNKYGKDKVCQILAMGTMGTKSVLKDAGRAMGADYIKYDEINDINKFVESDSNGVWPLDHCLFGDGEHGREPIKQIVEFAEKYPELIDVALDFQGIPRHKSTHAAGVVISPVNVTDILPLGRGKDGEVVSQFDKHWVEELGCLKMDFLGLTTLGVLHRTVDLVRQRYGTVIDLDQISLDDKNVLKMIKEGKTEGVFQIESPGMKDMFRQMNEVTFEDIIVGISLYRPGPMKMIKQYNACKNGFSEPQYLFPELKEVLESTYGIIVYQEQVIQIATKLAGYSEGAADLFRRAIGKKDEELIKEQINVLIYGQEEDLPKGKKYIPGLIEKGIAKDKAVELGENIVSFSAYAFNRSHSAAYAVLTMQTGYMKHYYPLEYMSAMISSFIQKSDDKINQYIDDVKTTGVQILPPDINKSHFEFVIEGTDIRYGFGAIKGISKSAITIIKEREDNGEFESIENFFSRFNTKQINKKTIDALIFSGSFDNLLMDNTRDEVFENVYLVRGMSNKKSKDEEGFNKLEEIDIALEKYLGKSSTAKAKQLYSKAFEDKSKLMMDLLQAEKYFLGNYYSFHPLEGKAEKIDWDSVNPGDILDVTGIIKKVKNHKTKNNDDMSFILFETINGDIDVTVFPNTHKACLNKLEPGGIRVFTVQAERNYKDPDKMSYIAKNIKYFRGEIADENIEIESQRECTRLAEEALL